MHTHTTTSYRYNYIHAHTHTNTLYMYMWHRGEPQAAVARLNRNPDGKPARGRNAPHYTPQTRGCRSRASNHTSAACSPGAPHRFQRTGREVDGGGGQRSPARWWPLPSLDPQVHHGGADDVPRHHIPREGEEKLPHEHHGGNRDVQNDA